MLYIHVQHCGTRERRPTPLNSLMLTAQEAQVCDIAHIRLRLPIQLISTPIHRSFHFQLPTSPPFALLYCMIRTEIRLGLGLLPITVPR